MTQIFQFKITLNEIKPSIWRRFLVKDNISFQKLHETIQVVMGWDDYHLYSFYLNKEEISPPDSENDSLNAKKIKLKDKLSLKNKFGYVYDFGDNWEHSLVVERIFDQDYKTPFIPFCLEGKRACPPEDCGSTWGYYKLQEIKKDKNHKEYEDMIVEWLGEDFDFEEFNLQEINNRLSTLVNTGGRATFWGLE